MKSIYILLTRSTSLPSKMIGFFTAEPFTHVSISFEDNLSVMYSFARKYTAFPLPGGLVEERIDCGFFGCQGDIPCELLKLDVPNKIYYKAKEKVQNMFIRRDDYHYNLLGLILCKMSIAYEFNSHYFCSQFVGKILSDYCAVDLPKLPSLMRPSDFADMSCFSCVYFGGLSALRSHRRNAAWSRVSSQAVGVIQ